MMRKLIALIILLSLASLLLASGCTTETAAEAPVSDALRRDAESYAEAHDVPLDEAIRRLKQQDPVGELNAVLQEQETGVFGGLWIQHEPAYRVIVLVTGDAADRARIRRRYVQGGPLEEMVEIREAQATLAELETAQAETLRILEEIGSRADIGVDVPGTASPSTWPTPNRSRQSWMRRASPCPTTSASCPPAPTPSRRRWTRRRPVPFRLPADGGGKRRIARRILRFLL